MSEFTILKSFKCNINPPKYNIIKEVLWHLIINWIKYNCDGASLINPGISPYGGIFRNNNAQFGGCFAKGLGVGNSLSA